MQNKRPLVARYPLPEGHTYRLGFDVGDRSVGIACVEFNDDNMPVKILQSVSFRHDGGMDPTTNKTPKSRKETAGVARRVRRMRRRRKQRLAALDRLLERHGYPVVDVSGGETYEPWQVRAKAVEAFIDDEQERKAAIARAARHIARHRGWRNPWLSFEGFAQLPTPTAHHVKNVEVARKELGVEFPDDATIAQVAVAASESNHVLRPRSGKNWRDKSRNPLMQSQVQQADQLAELHRILDTQQVSTPFADELCHAVFEQVRPYVPRENIGKDELPGMTHLVRAPKASLAFQEFRVRSAVANLRLREKPGSRTTYALDPEVVEDATRFLLAWDADDYPTWDDLAVALNIDGSLLVAPIFDDTLLKTAPTDKTSGLLRKKFTGPQKKKLAPVKEWWDAATRDERELFVEFISDPSDDVYEIADEAGLSDVFDGWSDEVKEILVSTQFESGRASYSVQSLRRLNSRMRTEGVDLHEARKREFGVDDSWKPTPPSIETRTGQPAVDRVLTIIRRATMGAVDKWGIPESLFVEHAREGLMGAAARDELMKEISRRTAQRESTRRVVAEQGAERPSDGDIAKWICITRQGNLCAYCGTQIGFTDAEMDHIVPRAGGGSNRQDNLVATCRPCNAQKGKMPFAVFAATTSRPEISMKATVDRVRSWDWARQEARVRNRMVQRLKRTEQDPEIDERSIASTAYAAVEVRQRLESYFHSLVPEEQLPKVEVYEGVVTREARRSGKIDKRIRIRGGDEKDRFDVRHHAIDAAVMTLITPSVALTLKERADRRRSAIVAPQRDPERQWVEYTGRNFPAQQKFALWRQQSHQLADLLVEEIAHDSIAVAQQLRLSASRGSVHKDTVRALQKKNVGAAWTFDEIQRVCDWDMYRALMALIPAIGKGLDEDTERKLTVPSGVMSAADPVALFPSAAASMVVGTGAVEIGEHIHHSRVYAWKAKNGVVKFGFLRIFTAELPKLQKLAQSKDLFTMSIDRASMSFRDLQQTVMKEIINGNAQEIGWLVQNDELVLDVEKLSQGKDKLAHFLKQYPESRWKLDGFPDNRRLRIRPLYLSREGAPAKLDDIAADVLERGAIASFSQVMPQVEMVVRRDGLGFERWSQRGSLPSSWNVMDAVRLRMG